MSGHRPFTELTKGWGLERLARYKARKVELAPTRTRPIGFMEGEIRCPDDFDTMGEEEIRRMFEGED